MNQSKLEAVEQEMARMNIDVLGISEVEWTGMGKFNSDDHYIYYYGQEYLRRNGVAIIVNRIFQNVVHECMLSCFSYHCDTMDCSLPVSSAHGIL